MGAEDDRAVAYTYAWWLTGDEHAAEAAVRAAARSPAVTGADRGRRLGALLREVRSLAAPEPTMCPASEIALLHDAHGVPLEEAAGLAAVDPDDARTELAHGRIEALVETVIDPFSHPERLGGLAVGNPADVAHARQCDSCRSAEELLERGRAELRALAAVPVPGAPAEPAGPGTGAPRGMRWRLTAAVLVAVALVAVLLLLLAGRGQAGPDGTLGRAAGPAGAAVVAG